jgi:SRSO17 transposase
VPPAAVLTDAGYGVDTAFRNGLTELGLPYIVGIQSSTSLWPPKSTPLTPEALERPRPSTVASAPRRRT